MLRYVVLAVAACAAVIAMANSKHPSKNDETIPIYNAGTGRVENVAPVRKTDAEWKALLTPEQYRVTRLKGTERPSGATCAIHADAKSGVYQCVCCGTDLFKFGTKFESGTGWPSFFEPVSKLNVRLEADDSGGRHRTEVLCARCGAHLGHVFDDGPPPTGKRYCMNSAALRASTDVSGFGSDEAAKARQGRNPETPAKREKATFAAGCFWGVESAFRELLGKGVISTRVGYTGGHTKNPTYEDVCSHTTGHAESVEVIYDRGKIGYESLLKLFWSIHDPTTPNRQGPDVGSQYRSSIFFHTPEQRALADKSSGELEKSKRFTSPIVTEIVAAGEFYPAEDHQQQYFEKCGIAPTCHLPVGD